MLSLEAAVPRRGCAGTRKHMPYSSNACRVALLAGLCVVEGCCCMQAWQGVLLSPVLHHLAGCDRKPPSLPVGGFSCSRCCRRGQRYLRPPITVHASVSVSGRCASMHKVLLQKLQRCCVLSTGRGTLCWAAGPGLGCYEKPSHSMGLGVCLMLMVSTTKVCTKLCLRVRTRNPIP